VAEEEAVVVAVVVVEEAAVVVLEEAVAGLAAVAGVAEGEPAAAEPEAEGPGRRAAGPVEARSAREGCRVRPGAGSAHALPAIPKPPISPVSPASIGTARTAGPA